MSDEQEAHTQQKRWPRHAHTCCSLAAISIGRRGCRHGPRCRLGGATVASQPVNHEERKPRAGCKRLPVIVCVLGPHSSSKRPVAVNMSPSQRRCEVARGVARGGGL